MICFIFAKSSFEKTSVNLSKYRRLFAGDIVFWLQILRLVLNVLFSTGISLDRVLRGNPGTDVKTSVKGLVQD